MIRSFRPVVKKGSRLLILGSMPGVRSLQENRYYAHPQNQFWRLIHDVLGVKDSGTYERRIRLLKDSRISLWDSLESCRRKGSADTSITSEKPNNIPQFLGLYPSIKAIACNGKASFKYLVKYWDYRDLPPIISLPSSSPANAALNYASKLKSWRRSLRRLL